MTKTIKSKIKRGGGCGCNSIQPTQQRGGNSGPSNIDSLPIRYYYGREDYGSAPTNPSELISARNMHGGKTTRRKKRIAKRIKSKRKYYRKTAKKMIGGTGFLPNNPVVSFNTPDWPSSGSNILSGVNVTNPSASSQPIDKFFNTMV
jgi:hypothetical protein